MRHIEAIDKDGKVVEKFDIPPLYGLPLAWLVRKFRPDIRQDGLTFREVAN